MPLRFELKRVNARFNDAAGKNITRDIEIRKNPVTLKTSRVTYSRALEKERGAQTKNDFGKDDLDEKKCPFCPGNLKKMTPTLSKGLGVGERLRLNNSLLFPNLFPYTKWSAVALFDEHHCVKIGDPTVASYRDCLINCSRYLNTVLNNDEDCVFMAVTQNYLPAAGGSLVHPHLQIHAENNASNSHRQMKMRADTYKKSENICIYTDYIEREKELKDRYIGSTGKWEWAASFSPEGFFEIWGICKGAYSLMTYENEEMWEDLARGIINTQKFYRSLGRNSYNLGIISVESGEKSLELKVSIAARSNYAPWTRSDITGFEFTHHEMATFTSPESTAGMARKFWNQQ